MMKTYTCQICNEEVYVVEQATHMDKHTAQEEMRNLRHGVPTVVVNADSLQAWDQIWMRTGFVMVEVVDNRNGYTYVTLKGMVQARELMCDHPVRIAVRDF